MVYRQAYCIMDITSKRISVPTKFPEIHPADYYHVSQLYHPAKKEKVIIKYRHIVFVCAFQIIRTTVFLSPALLVMTPHNMSYSSGYSIVAGVKHSINLIPSLIIKQM